LEGRRAARRAESKRENLQPKIWALAMLRRSIPSMSSFSLRSERKNDYTEIFGYVLYEFNRHRRKAREKERERERERAAAL
jgi:hypothetical protein